MVKPLPGKLLEADEYARRHNSDYGYEATIVRARQNCLLRQLARWEPGRVLEVGCGPSLLAARAIADGVGFSQWTIVEPAENYVAAAAALAHTDSRLHAVRGYLESSVDELHRVSPTGFDTVIASSVLHETTAPDALLRAAVELLRPGGRMVVTVPNAMSFHRLLAVKMGLIPSPETITDRNITLGQSAVFTPQTLSSLLTAAGFGRQEIEGYLFKLFTNEQMEQIAAILDARVVDALEELGRDFPQHAAEICITGTLAPD